MKVSHFTQTELEKDEQKNHSDVQGTYRSVFQLPLNTVCEEPVISFTDQCEGDIYHCLKIWVDTQGPTSL
jgi:hypothetical protein